MTIPLAEYPEHLKPTEATSIWMQYMTAYGALIEIGRLKKESMPMHQHPELFNWDKVNNVPSMHVPYEVLATNQPTQQAKRI